jgi:hypothetical protein
LIGADIKPVSGEAVILSPHGGCKLGYIEDMQVNQVSVWVPIVVGFIGLVGVIAGQLVNAWREDRRWSREQRQQDLRWRREADREAANHAHASLIDWRERRISTYGAFLDAIQELISITREASSFKVTTLDSIELLRTEYDERTKVADSIGQRVRLLGSDPIVSTMKHQALTLRYPLALQVPRVPRLRFVNPTPERLQQEAEEDRVEIAKTKDGLRTHITHLLAYYNELVEQMRVDLGAASLTSQ